MEVARGDDWRLLLKDEIGESFGASSTDPDVFGWSSFVVATRATRTALSAPATMSIPH
jgi:hypothetical protein